jgi:A/G-specific adenine glycosylase
MREGSASLAGHRTFPPTKDIRRFRRLVLQWDGGHGRQFPWRRPSVPLYRLVVTEALLQRTRAETVASFYPDFFKRFRSWVQLAAVSEADLGLHLKPIGLWKRRAATLSGLAQVMASRRGRFPRDRANVEELPGVGQYVANSIFLFAHSRPEPLLDGSMARVLERYFGPRRLADIRYDPYLQKLARAVIDCTRARDANWAILDLASLVCKQRTPLCSKCPLRLTCLFNNSKETSL